MTVMMIEKMLICKLLPMEAEIVGIAVVGAVVGAAVVVLGSQLNVILPAAQSHNLTCVRAQAAAH